MVVVCDFIGHFLVEMPPDLPWIEIGSLKRENGFIVSERWCESHAGAHLVRYIRSHELIPLQCFFTDPTLVIKHPIPRPVDSCFVHEGGNRKYDVIEAEKVWAVELVGHVTFCDEIIVRPRRDAFNSEQGRSLS